MLLRIRKRAGWIITAVLAAIPVALWMVAAPVGPRFSGASAALRSISILCAFAGVSLFAVNIVLGARLQWVEPLFGGMDRLYRAHRHIGSTSFILILAHPLFMAYSYATSSIELAARLFIFDNNWTLNFGRLALLSMIATISVSLFKKLKHETFIKVQKTFGVAFLLATLHVFRTPGTKAISPALEFYIWALTIVAVWAYLYRSVFGRILVRRYEYWVREARKLDDTVVEIVMTPTGKRMRFRPGQFLVVSFRGGGVPEEPHPFSIASAPHERDLRIVVKALGDFTRTLQDLRQGATAWVEGPYGGFVPLRVKNPRQVWIAGGIGITPFLSMARSFEATGWKSPYGEAERYEIDFYYATETAEESHFLDELFEIADRHLNFRVIPIRRTSLGFLTAEDIAGASRDIEHKDICVCGPPAMITSLKGQLARLGVPKDKVHYEEFSFV